MRISESDWAVLTQRVRFIASENMPISGSVLETRNFVSKTVWLLRISMAWIRDSKQRTKWNSVRMRFFGGVFGNGNEVVDEDEDDGDVGDCVADQGNNCALLITESPTV